MSTNPSVQTVNVAGTADIGGATTITGATTMTGLATCNGGLTVAGAATVSGAVTIGSPGGQAATMMHGDITSTGHAIIGGNTTRAYGQIYAWSYAGETREEWNSSNGARIIFSCVNHSAIKTGSLAWVAVASDSRLKTDIVAVAPADAAARINALRLVTYRWSPEYAALKGVDTAYTWTGLISQEYYGVYPTLEAERPHEMLDLGGGDDEQA
jgi:hypothetical protein